MSQNNSIIPIKNIYYMLCYAWNVLSIKDEIKLKNEQFDDIYNLLSKIFLYGVNRIIKSGFHRTYVEKEEELCSLKGKINIQESIKIYSQDKKQLVCVYDDYSMDNYFNGIIKYTIKSLLKNNSVDKNIKNEIRRISFFFKDINEIEPTKKIRRQLIFNRNNVFYKMLIRVCTMLYDNTIPSDEAGINNFMDFYREDQMQKVFEIFLLNFYKINLGKEYKVYSSIINWQTDETAKDTWIDMFDVEVDPGDRRTDIVIENDTLNYQFIVDAKFYQKTFTDRYMDPNGEGQIRTSHLNQVRGYVLDSQFNGKKLGALIYPMVNDDLKKGTLFPIKESYIIAKTVNLNADWQIIEEDLIDFVKRVETKI